MATAALFIGWGPAVIGREQKAVQVFSEVVQYYTQLQQQGTIESFEPVALEPHGGELQGFLLIRGEQEKLNQLRTNEDFMRLNNRGSLVVQNLGVVGALIGEGLQRLFADFQAQAADLS